MTSHRLESLSIGDTYDVVVRVPAAYGSDMQRRFPVVLQLDGKVPSLEEFDVTARLASELEAEGGLGPVIIVGVSSATGEGKGRGRSRDYTFPNELPDVFQTGGGGAEPFLEFCREELLPFLEAEYRVSTSREGRALFGHSLGGLFGTFAFTQPPALFGAIVAASPSLVYDGGGIHAYLERLPTTGTFPSVLMLTAGTLEGPEMVVPVRDVAESTRLRAFPGLTVIDRTFPVDHIGSIEPSFREGLRLLHQRGWDAP